MSIGRLILFIFTGALTILFMLMIAICITIAAEYKGAKMGNEAYGYYSAAWMFTFLISIPTIILWVIIMKRRKNKNAAQA